MLRERKPPRVLMRSAGAYMTKLGYTDFTKSTTIKKLTDELSQQSGVITRRS